MYFSNAPLALGLLASTALAAPVPGDSQAPGSTCTTWGKVVCNDAKFKVCASGVWSVEMSLAQGMDCTMFSNNPAASAAVASAAASGVYPTGPVASPSAPASAPSAPAGAPSAPASAPAGAPSAPAGASSPAAGSPSAPAASPSAPAGASAPAASPSAPAAASQSEGIAAHQTPSAPGGAPTPSAPGGAPTPSAPGGAPTPTAAPSQSGGSTGGGSGTQSAAAPGQSQSYSGGESSFPGPDKWVSFEKLWDLNQGVCNLPANKGKGPLIKSDIQQVAGESGVDARIILAVLLQESTCQLSAVTTNGGVNNPGLMQSHNGVGYDGTDGSILQMIRDGTEGTNGKPDGGDGLKQTIAAHGIYGGLRAYNSGDGGIMADLSQTPPQDGTPSYCSDVANRLTGAKIAT